MPHSEYIQKLRKGVKGSPAVAAFNLHANARRASDEAHQLMAAGGIVTSVDDAAELEKVEYWQQGDASLATKEKMEARQALRHHKVVLEALQMYWEAAQRSLHSGGDPSANELHQEGHALMLRRIYRVMIKDFDPDECERSIAEDWARDTKGKETLSRKLFCDAFFELADTWTAGIDAHEYAAFLKVLFGTVTVKKPVVGADGQLIMVSFVWKDEVDCVFDEAYAEEVEEIIEQEQPAVVASAGKSAVAPAVTTKPPRDAKQSATPPRDAKAGTTDVPDPEPQPISSTPKKRKDYRARAKDGIKKKGEDTSKKSQAAKVIQSKHRQRKAVKEKETRKQAVATIHKQAAKKVANNQKKRAKERAPERRSREDKGEGRSVAGVRGQMQYWALRKGIPPRLQEAFDELCEEDQETVASLSEEKRIKFLRRGITDKGLVSSEAIEGLDPRLRAVFIDLTRADQIVISEMLPEKRWAFLQRRPDAIERASRPLHERMLERSLVWVQAEDGTTRHLRLRHAIGVGFRRAIEERGANWLNFTVGWEGGTQARKVKPSDPLTAGAFFYPAAAVKRTETELAGAFFYPAATRLEGSRYGLLFHEPAPPQLPKGERSSSRLAGPAKGPYTGLSDSHLDAQIAALEYNRALDSLMAQEQSELDATLSSSPPPAPPPPSRPHTPPQRYPRRVVDDATYDEAQAFVRPAAFSPRAPSINDDLNPGASVHSSTTRLLFMPPHSAPHSARVATTKTPARAALDRHSVRPATMCMPRRVTTASAHDGLADGFPLRLSSQGGRSAEDWVGNQGRGYVALSPGGTLGALTWYAPRYVPLAPLAPLSQSTGTSAAPASHFMTPSIAPDRRPKSGRHARAVIGNVHRLNCRKPLAETNSDRYYGDIEYGALSREATPRAKPKMTRAEYDRRFAPPMSFVLPAMPVGSAGGLYRRRGTYEHDSCMYVGLSS